MSEFENVTVTKPANIYFDGAVTKTLGIMQPGAYRFTTGKPEIMEILSGEVEVKLEGENQWHSYKDGGHFEVPGNSAFDIRVSRLTDYCCSFVG